MVLERRGFIILPENEKVYFAQLEGIINSVDELAMGEVIKNPQSYNFRISPSTPEYCQPLLTSLLTFNTLMGVRMNMSKSIRKLSAINFSITME